LAERALWRISNGDGAYTPVCGAPTVRATRAAPPLVAHRSPIAWIARAPPEPFASRSEVAQAPCNGCTISTG